MDLTKAFYTAVGFAWTGLVFGAWVAIDQGLTAPGLTFADVPGGSAGGMAGVIGVALVGWSVVSKLNTRHERAKWLQAGEQLGLSPVGDGGTGDAPELTGSVDGRTVGARYEKRKVGTGESNSWVTFTVGEADLDGPAERGLVVGRAGETLRADGPGSLRFDEFVESAHDVEGLVPVESGGLVGVGTSAPVAEAVADGALGETLRSFDDLEVASLGDGAGVVETWTTARNEDLEGSVVEFPVDRLVERVPGDAATVTVEVKEPMRNSDDLRRLTERAATIAAAYEEAASPARSA